MIIVNYIPSWFPGTGFKAFAAVARKSAQDLARIPFEHSKARIVSRDLYVLFHIIHNISKEMGTAPPSFVSDALTELTDDSQMDLLQDIKEVAATMYGGSIRFVEIFSIANKISRCIRHYGLYPPVLYSQPRSQPGNPVPCPH